ncbi:urease accessory protein [Sanguibacter gelidistatuariae]|uniref:Urease accessory protein UreF n=1 Tax=Sanguibacter gelidistatuariae TaxID=1814289 RepID=A0A1G6GX61_9MICO|nr:urease accessory UreF family protein [Sanguibacter gelidistatuariae]SDB86265.1 urease accessory protein [Sanguibacter gelidistatuariae]
MQPTARTLPALLLLADGRFPAGGHAHSGGFEAAAQREGIDDVDALEQFLLGRLHTAGLLAAAFSSASCHAFARSIEVTGGSDVGDRLDRYDQELSARTPSPVLRVVSRRLGRQVIRVARRVWPSEALERLAKVPGAGLHQPIAFGAVAAAAGLSPEICAVAAAQESIAGPATASVRLLGLDPFDVNATLARLSDEVGRVAADGAAYAASPPEDLPARAGYLLDISAEAHATWEVRLFAS